jgi:hypothetical protein
MSHKDWLHSVRTNDGRKWSIEEVDGQSYYTEIPPGAINPYQADQVKRNRERKAKLIKTTCKEETPYTWRQGYNICTGQYTGGNSVPILSGSTFNRKKPKKYPAKKSAELPIHVMSKRSKGKIRDKAQAFFAAVKERTFVTLTFIDHIDDREAKACLNKFLTVVRKEVKGFEYLVISEHQQERPTKTIHFHMLANKKLPVGRFNALWVLQQYNAGLVGHRANGEAISGREIVARYNDKTMGEVLNPFQIENAHCISSIANYLTKYVTKQSNGEEFGCLTWHCSRKVSRLFTSMEVSPSTFRYMTSFVNYKVDRETGQCWPPAVMSGAFYTLVFVNNKPAARKILAMLEAVNRWIIDKDEPDRTLKDAYQRYGGGQNKFDPSRIVEEIIAHVELKPFGEKAVKELQQN